MAIKSKEQTGKSQQSVKVQELCLPQGGGAIKGLGETFAANEFNGTSSVTIPIPATPCRGFEPSLSLDYSSGNGNSAFGLGWSLGLPEIARQTSKGVPEYNDNDTFLLTGDDYLVPVLDKLGLPMPTTAQIGANQYQVQAYQPRTEVNFSRIERYTNTDDLTDVFWQVTDNDNITHVFGKSQMAKIVDPADSTRIYKWLLEEVFDAKGNHQLFQYQKENADGLDVHDSEYNRDHQTSSYLVQVLYGNDCPITDNSLLTGASQWRITDVSWHFVIVFDYGAYDITPANARPDVIPEGRVWQCRRDPFSDYSAGFEIRTYRLCQNILLLHDFSEIGSDGPALCSVLSLCYNASSRCSLLNSVEQTGYQYDAQPQKGQKPYITKALPATEFAYTPFAPANPSYQTLAYQRFNRREESILSQVTDQPDYRLVDLYGAGIPGVLYADGQSLCYSPPQYSSTVTASYEEANYIEFPVTGKVLNENHTLTDVTGNGRFDVLVSTPGQAGYYAATSDGTWQAFVPFESFPVQYHQANNSKVDMNGDGLADFVLIDEDQVLIYPSERNKGFGIPLQLAREHNVPESAANSATQLLDFAAMIGSGPPQRVRIRQNQVMCWPSLGYGHFGKPVSMGNAPDLGDDFDVARLRLADIDGSGNTDLVYISSNHVDIYINQSGNGFAEKPIRIELPTSWDRLNQIQFVDVCGNGTQCLVISQTHPQPQQWYYDFSRVTADSPDVSEKPYLLNTINNNMGARTELTYAGSPQFYLQDKAAGLPWISCLPFPVNVVASVTYHDEVSQTSTSHSYRYHHGYFDGIEREFRGFGRVDRTDTASFADFCVPTTPEQAAYLPPPMLTKTWYHTGIYLAEDKLLRQYQKEYWQGDTQAYAMPATKFCFIDTPDGDALIGAHRSLEGAVLRTEVYGRDASPWQDTPYSVSETQFTVSQLQRQGGNQYCVFMNHDQQTISYDYERNAADPRIVHTFNLEFDDYGQVLQACEVNYGRRQLEGAADNQQQHKTWVTYQRYRYINSPALPKADFYCLGANLSQQVYEIDGLAPQRGSYFSFLQIKRQTTKALANGQSKLLHWARDYYYDAITEKELPYGELSAQGLHHRTEFIAFDIKTLTSNSEFEFLTAKNELQTLLMGDGAQYHGAKGGFITFPDGEESHYYWNPGGAQSYDANQFYLPNAYFDPFQYPYIHSAASHIDADKAVKTRYVYDRYALLNTKVIDPLNNQTQVTKIDYQTLQATQMVDPNGNVSTALIDPLAMVVVTSHHGCQADTRVAFANLDNYQPQTDISTESVIQDAAQYLQLAASFFYYDLHSWKDNAIPVHGVILNYDDYTFINARQRKILPGIQKAISYQDGFGRQLQSKTYFDAQQTQYDARPQQEQTWLTSGAKRYNGKGEPIKQYEPFFSATYAYSKEKALSQTGFSETLFYDALGRNVVNLSPEGFVSKTLFGNLQGKTRHSYQGYLNNILYADPGGIFQPTAWSDLDYDANDAIKDSNYRPMANADVDQQAYAKALKFANTPFQHDKNGLGYVIQSQQLNVLEVEKNANFANFDIRGNELSSSDQRLHAVNQNNFHRCYNLQNVALKVVSADAGTQWILPNVLGQTIYRKDSRNFESFYSFDALNRPAQTYVQGGDGKSALAQTVELCVYGDSLSSDGKAYFDKPQTLNLRGQTVLHLDQAGLSLLPSFSIAGDPLLEARWLNIDYKNTSNWLSITDLVITEMAAIIDGKYQRHQFETLQLPAPVYALLESERFITSEQFDALGRVLISTDADGNQRKPVYYSTNWLKSLNVVAGDSATQTVDNSQNTPGVLSVNYNAKGQRTAVHYSNGVVTRYIYDQKSFRLTAIKSTRGTKVLQDLLYHHDPEGNVSTVDNQVVPSVFFKNQKVGSIADFTTDSLYRLTLAKGREHSGMWNNVQSNQNKFNAACLSALGSPLSDYQALQKYTQQFCYDEAGNLTAINHSGEVATRRTVVQAGRHMSNRVETSVFGGKHAQPVHYHYDACGNMINLDGTAGTSWNYRNQLQSVTLIDRDQQQPDAEYYVYDSAGNRVRKVWIQKTLAGRVINEVIYLGGIEIRRCKNQAHNTAISQVTEQWHTVRVMDSDECFCVWRYWQQGKVKPGSALNQQRYQLNDSLKSSCQELDETGKIITYEEYYPYGGSSIMAGKNQVEVNTKQYHYSGKEKDNSTGLYYYGMRYYVAWLGRWNSTDPAGTIDGLNVYAFVGGNPVTEVDDDGLVKSRKRKLDEISGVNVGGKNTVSQSNLAGESSKKGRTKFYIGKPDKKFNRNYLTIERTVFAMLKINGIPFLWSKNGKAANELEFEGVGIFNQKGTKINFHAEDWLTNSFRHMMGKYQDNEGRDKNLDDFLKKKELPNKKGNLGERNVFSIKLNFSPCEGCADTLIAFKKYLTTIDGDDPMLRVKFLRPYNLAKTIKSRTTKTVKSYENVIRKLQNAGIFVRTQPVESAKKMTTDSSIAEKLTKENLGHTTIESLSPDTSHETSKTWTAQGARRKNT